MIVKCIANDLKSLKESALVDRLKKYIHLSGPDNDLVIDKHYAVQAIGNRDGHWWYYIHSVDVNDYPYPYPSEYFEVVNNALPSNWAIKMEMQNNQFILMRISFPEWVNDDLFYEKLVDDNASCKEIYIKHIKHCISC